MSNYFMNKCSLFFNYGDIMPRPRKMRRVFGKPNCSVFKPAGVPLQGTEPVTLALDELEAVRLADVEGLYQEDAAKQMNTSRPTFTRILAEGRRKIATAISQARPLVIEGGNVNVCRRPNMPFSYSCKDCNAEFNNAAAQDENNIMKNLEENMESSEESKTESANSPAPSECPKCGSENISQNAAPENTKNSPMQNFCRPGLRRRKGCRRGNM
jgi:predicted DNA-binding protein (UPF0251 family)